MSYIRGENIDPSEGISKLGIDAKMQKCFSLSSNIPDQLEICRFSIRNSFGVVLFEICRMPCPNRNYDGALLGFFGWASILADAKLAGCLWASFPYFYGL